MAPHEAPFPGDGHPTVVGVGTSAGGLAALKAFFAEVPADSGIAWVVVVHLSPEHESHLAELLQPHIHVPVQQVTESVLLEPDRVYVIPPDANLNAVDTHLRLSDLEERRYDRAPIDHFFRTLSETHDGHAVGVILSGTGADGTLGLKEIKRKGGLTVVQDPRDAEYDGMPQSAVATGMVDLVLPLARIPGAILDYVATDPRVQLPATEEDVAEAELRLLQKIFTHVRSLTGRDFSRYKRSTTMRRVVRRMQLTGIEDPAEYLAHLRQDPDEVHTLSDDLLITVTSFFRDAEVFDVLEKEVVPRLFEAKEADEEIRVWSIGCATGEEAYSLAMLLMEEASERGASAPRLQVFASDLHEPSLRRAREGYYSGDIEADLSEERLGRFFQKEDGAYRIRKEVRDLVVFAPHNVLADPPFSRIDLVSCRNLLIYLQRDVQTEVFELLHYALRPDGWLVLGTSETIDANELFRTEFKKACIHQKRNARGPEPRLPVFPLRWASHATAMPATDRGSAAYGAIHQRVVERYAPPSLLVNPDDRVLHLSDHAGRYLVHPGGDLTSSVFELVREELRVELRTAVHEARERRAPHRTQPVPVRFNGESGLVALDVRPALERDGDGFLLIIFDERASEAGREAGHQSVAAGDRGDAEADEAGTGSERLRTLEAERDLARQRLHAVVEEFETSQEEMKASNEELQSINEELRSTMEELETSKEELQSMNEELQTVNQENRHKVEELSQLSSDLQNLMAATDIATLFLDRDFRILRFTPSVGELFNIRLTDRGRPLSDLTNRLPGVDLLPSAEQVLADLVRLEVEVEDDRGRWYLTRLLPYRSTDDRIEGVVLTFVEITGRKRAEELLRELNDTLEHRIEARTREVRQSEERFGKLVEASAQMVWTTDDARRVIGESPMWRAFTGQTPEEQRGDGWADAIHPDDRKDVLEHWGHAVTRQEPVHSEFRLWNAATGAWRWNSVRAVPLRGPRDEPTGWIGMSIDVHERKRAEEDVRELASTLTVAEQRERHRLSRILHDDLQQLLYGMQMKLDVVRQQVGDGDPASLRSQIDRSLELLAIAVERTRHLSVSLSPPVLEGEGLRDAVEWLRGYMADLHGLEVEVRGSGDVTVEREVMRALVFEIVRELLFNVAKHAGVDHALVELTMEDGVATVSVTDEGCGFEAEALRREEDGPAGLGLFSARERLRLHGGRLEVQTRPGQGTRVVVYAPVSTSATEARSDSER